MMKKMKTNIKKMKVWDIGLIKWGCIGIGLIVGAYFPAWIIANIIWIAAIAIVLNLVAVYRFLTGY